MMLKPALRPPLRAPMRGATTLREGVGGWWDASSVLDMDFANGRFRWNGVSYTDETAFLAAIGGSKSGITRTIGPFVDPAATEMISNGDFAGGTTGWTATQVSGGPATIAVVSGALEVTGASSNSPGAYQQITTVPGKAYQLRGKTAWGAGNTTQIAKAAVSSQTAMGGTHHYGDGVGNGSATLAEDVREFAMHGTAAYVGLRAVHNPATQKYLLDDVSVKECTPFKGFTAGQAAGVIRGTTPAAASGNKVIWQADANMQTATPAPIERNYIRLVWDASKRLRLIASYQTALNTTVEQANLDLGVVEVNTPFVVAFSATLDSFSASLDGQPAVTDTSGLFPGCAVMRVCRSQSGDTWDGSIDRVTLF